MKAALREARWVGVTILLLAAALTLGTLALKQSPVEVFRLIATQVLFDGYGLGQTLYKATMLIFTGLACSLAFRCGLFNIGAEGQLYAGAFAMTLVGLRFPGLPPVVLVPLMLAVAAAGGAAWAVVPAVLKAKRGAHEVITTMMMNFVAMALANYLISSRFHEPETIHTAELPAAAGLPSFETMFGLFKGSPVNASLLIGLVLAAAIAYFLWRTPTGFEWRAVGVSPDAARTSGVKVSATTIKVMLASGAVSGLAGSNFVLGYKHYFEQGFASGAGFLGIAVALVAKNNPIGVIPSALLFAFLSQAGLTLNRTIPREMFEILQAAAILIVVIAQQRLGGEPKK
jgi:simple sugar transport system permease protein